MSVIIRLQNLPWSANALDIRNFFRGLSIPEGGVHIVGGELGDAFIAFSTDEDARQAMMLDGGKIKEIQVKLLLSSRSEMHKVIEAARQSVPILSLTAPIVSAPTPAPVPIISAPVIQPPISIAPTITPFSAALGNNPLSSFGIPGIGNPQEIPQPAVIEAPTPTISPPIITPNPEIEKDDDRLERRRSKEKDRRRSRSRSRSRSRDRDRKVKRDRRDRSRSRERRRRDRSRSRDRRDRKRDRKDRSRSRERSPTQLRRPRDRRNERKSPNSQEKNEISNVDPAQVVPHQYGNQSNPNIPISMQHLLQTNPLPQNGPAIQDVQQSRFNDPITEAYNKLQELGKKRNPNAFQGDQNGSASRFNSARGGATTRGTGSFRRDGRPSRFDEPVHDCCVAIRNAPTHTSYGDVRRFFPFLIDKHGIKMINDNMGRRTGNIFVRFCESRSRQIVLQRKINELKGEIVAVEPLTDEDYEAAVDSFLPYREENDDEDPSIIIPEQEELSQETYSVLKMSDLPNYVKEHDIIKSFSDYSLLSIMLTDCRETKTKIAYIQFVKSEDAKTAFERKDRYVFGRRQAVITPITDEEYEKEKTLQIERPQEPVIEPAEEKPSQETQMPRDPRQRRQNADSVTGPKSGSSLSQNPPQAPFFAPPFGPQQNFPPQFAAQQFGGFPGNLPMDPRTAAANWANRPPFSNQMAAPIQPPVQNRSADTGVNMEDERLDCVLMKGLPADATDRTIVKFLSDTGAVPARIHLMLDPNGLPSGDCFCEFRSPQEARRATTKHGQNLDGCRISVDLVTQAVVEEALEGPKQPEVRDGLLGNVPNLMFNASQQSGFISSRGSFRGRGGFERGFDRGGYGRGGFESRGGFRGRGGWSERGPRGGFDPRGGYIRGRGRGFGRGRGGFENGRDHTEMRKEEEQDPALEDFGAPGCVVSMENVPFRATVDDILNFFGDFDLTQDDVIRRFNERGQPTGDARVAFRTPFDAQRAVKTRHMNVINDRRITLSVL